MPSIVASKKVQLVLQDSSAVAKTFNQETINGISVNLGPKEKPLVRITARQIPANMSLSALVPDIAIFPDATKFKSGAATLVDIEGFAGVDMGSWYHPDLVPPTLGQRNLDPNTVLKAVKTVLDNLVSDNSKQVTYANLVNGLKSVLASEGKTWDSTGYLNQELAIAKSLVPDGITPSVILYTNPLMNIPVQGGGGGGCSLVR
jgi:hypothetical protein